MERLTLISSKIILSLFDNVRKGHFLVHKVKRSFNQTKTDVSLIVKLSIVEHIKLS